MDEVRRCWCGGGRGRRVVPRRSGLGELATAGDGERAAPAESAYPQTRAEAVEAWTAELKEAGEELPEDWEVLTTEEIKGRYVSQRLANAPKAEDIDPGMARRVGD